MLRLDDLHVDSFATTHSPSGPGAANVQPVTTTGPVPLTTGTGSYLGCTEYSCYADCGVSVTICA